MEIETSRRNVLYGVAAAGFAVPLVAACGSGDDGSGPVGVPASDPPTSGGTTPAGESIPTSDIPVGGGAIYPEEKLVVTQPTAGEFKAFSAVCTHQQCLVTKVEDGKIDCTCHGSEYSITDGSVERGPASKPLAEKTVTVSAAGDSLTVS
ncbi:Rieske (2Fe-2S) protein [Nocardioides marmoriginsengisoli]|uniref:Cytochrome bc1 complex Rieske iron-sulfur subunit n=1 Tax=Nocardioides marmoriginsengisoli TaxID=661483 RepID=A0A3N0C906_9ACTN|nr:Rieske (2Fe-2S) protein [Nocardioides marmoriginsengisoli]RNL59948.1 Rieske (2Fe-2S) protein [Nocardioides marmoriginsengisoli]